MMDNILKYKGYFTKIEFSAEDNVLHGKIEAINDLVNFEADNVADIEKEFHLAVDDYLDYCKAHGKDPDKTYSGSFNVRIDPELHKKISLKASDKDLSLNKAVELAITEYVDEEKVRLFTVPSQIYNGALLLASAASSASRQNAWAGGVANG